MIVPDTGSGYGGKHTGDAALEAARLAKAVGKPVKRDWTREEEMTWAYFRPGGLIEVAGKAAPDGTITEWEFHNYNSGGSRAAIAVRALPSKKEQYPPVEIAAAAGIVSRAGGDRQPLRARVLHGRAGAIGEMDPLEFRLKNAKDERLRDVIIAAADKFGWKAPQEAAGRGFGIAAGFEKGGYVATCAEVSRGREDRRGQGAARGGGVRVRRRGESRAPAQSGGGRGGQGIGGALFEQIEFADGKIANNRLSRYRVPRFSDMPVIESVLLDRKDLVSAGAGETPIVGIAPAIGNAIFDANGKRIRRLPLMS